MDSTRVSGRIASDDLSPWWKIVAIVTMIIGFSTLILLTVKAYQDAPPIPCRSSIPPAR